MPTNYMLIDGNSLGHFYNNAKKLSIGSLEVQAIFGTLRGLRQQMANYQSFQPVVLWDGASWRKQIFSTYKEIRDREETKNEIRLKLMKDAYKIQVPYIKKALRFLGIPQVFALNMEADDLGAILTDRYTAGGSKIVLLTGDKDWLQLVGPGVVWRDFANTRLISHNGMTKDGTKTLFEELTGVKTTREFVEVKALCGDTGDSVPGVGGIGEKGAIEFVKTYGSFRSFVNAVTIDKTVDFKKLPKKFKDLIVDEGKAIAFMRNVDLVDLRTTARPAPLNLQIDKGDPSFEKFQRFCDLLLFSSITKDLEEWIRVFPAFRDRQALQEAA
jgi:5'-3' exonuclease